MENYTHLAENIIEIYTKHARAWTELRGEFLYEKAWLDRFLTLIPAHSHILTWVVVQQSQLQLI